MYSLLTLKTPSKACICDKPNQIECQGVKKMQWLAVSKALQLMGVFCTARTLSPSTSPHLWAMFKDDWWATLCLGFQWLLLKHGSQVRPSLYKPAMGFQKSVQILWSQTVLQRVDAQRLEWNGAIWPLSTAKKKKDKNFTQPCWEQSFF